jgi:HK97 family phage major capsid protein
MSIEVKDIKAAAEEAIAPIKEQFKELNSQLEKQKGEFEAMVKDKADTKSLNDMQADLTKTASALEAAKGQLDRLEGRMEQGEGKKQEGGLMHALKSQVFTDANIPNIKSGQKMSFENIDVKAVSDMTTGYSATAGLLDIFANVESGIAKAPKAKPTVLDFIRTGTTNNEILKWVIKTLTEGGIGQTAEGVKFNQVSYKWDKEQAIAKKTTGYSKISKEHLDGDLPFALTETIAEMSEDFLIQLGTQILLGNNAGENHNGVYTQAPAFAKQTGVGTLTGVTMRDVLEHAYLQVRVAGKGSFRPNAVLMNPVDVTKLKTLKDSTGQYIMPLYLSNTGFDVNGIPIVEDDNIVAGNFLMGDFTKYGLFVYRNLSIQTYEQNEDDALKDYLTIAGSLRAISRLKTPEIPAFVKGTFSTAITALQA